MALAITHTQTQRHATSSATALLVKALAARRGGPGQPRDMRRGIARASTIEPILEAASGAGGAHRGRRCHAGPGGALVRSKRKMCTRPAVAPTARLLQYRQGGGRMPDGGGNLVGWDCAEFALACMRRGGGA